MNSWYQNARTALFIHWGIATGNAAWQEKKLLYSSTEEFEQAANSAGWDAGKWVAAAKKLRASYISFAIFHGSMAHMKAWKSDIPGTPTTNRDFLGELIEKADQEGIRVILYIGGQPFFQDFPWVDPSEYGRWKGDLSIDITDHAVWQKRYVREIIEEVIDRYPKLAGFWFDGWNNDKTCEELFGAIHDKNPQLVVIRNNFHDRPCPGEDVMSLEGFAKVYEPEYDYPSGCWCASGGKECAYTMEELSDWWYWYQPKPYDRKKLIRKLVSIAANGWVASMGLGPDIGGNFIGTIGNFLDDVDGFFQWAEESIKGTVPARIPVMRTKDGSYGMATKNEKYYYLHLLETADGGVVESPDGGIEFEEAMELKTGKTLNFTQENGMIKIIGELDQRDGDSIIRLTPKGSRSIFQSKVEEFGQPLPCSVEVHLEKVKTVDGMLLEQEDCSCSTRGGWAGVENNRLKDYEVWTSCDGKEYTLTAKGTCQGRRGVQQIGFSKRKAKYIRLKMKNSYQTDRACYKKFDGLNWSYLAKPDCSLKVSDTMDDGSVWSFDGNIICIQTKDQQQRWEVPYQIQALTVKEKCYILTEDGRIFGVDSGGNNVYIIGHHVDEIAMDEKGTLYAHMPAADGTVMVKQIDLLGKEE